MYATKFGNALQLCDFFTDVIHLMSISVHFPSQEILTASVFLAGGGAGTDVDVVLPPLPCCFFCDAPTPWIAGSIDSAATGAGAFCFSMHAQAFPVIAIGLLVRACSLAEHQGGG